MGFEPTSLHSLAKLHVHEAAQWLWAELGNTRQGISIPPENQGNSNIARTCIILCTYDERSVIETRQSKATTPEDNSIFLKRKRRAASGGTRTRDVLHTRQTLYQLSNQGSSAGQAESLNVMQRHSRLSPDILVHVGRNVSLRGCF